MLKSFVESCGGPVELHPYQGVVIARDPVSGRQFLLPADFAASLQQSERISTTMPVAEEFNTPTRITPRPIVDRAPVDQSTPRFSHSSPRTPTKRRRWNGPVLQTLTPQLYRPEHMLWGTSSQKHRIGLGVSDEIPRNIADARNHLKAAVKRARQSLGITSLGGRRGRLAVQELVTEVVKFCPRLEEVARQDVVAQVRELARCGLSYDVQKRKRRLDMNHSVPESPVASFRQDTYMTNFEVQLAFEPDNPTVASASVHGTPPVTPVTHPDTPQLATVAELWTPRVASASMHGTPPVTPVTHPDTPRVATVTEICRRPDVSAVTPCTTPVACVSEPCTPSDVCTRTVSADLESHTDHSASLPPCSFRALLNDIEDDWTVGSEVICQSEKGTAIFLGEILQVPSLADGLQPSEQMSTALLTVLNIFPHDEGGDSLPVSIDYGKLSDIKKHQTIYWPISSISGGRNDAHAEENSPTAEDDSSGLFVAVAYHRAWYVGKREGVTAEDRVRITFLKKRGKVYAWPFRADVDDVEREYILPVRVDISSTDERTYIIENISEIQQSYEHFGTLN